MKKEEFLEMIFKMYEKNFTEGNKKLWLRAYKSVLTDNLDYTDVYRHFVNDYMSINTAPAPAWFNQFRKSCLLPIVVDNKKSEEKLEPMPEDFKKSLEKLKTKLTIIK